MDSDRDNQAVVRAREIGIIGRNGSNMVDKLITRSALMELEGLELENNQGGWT